MAKIGVVFYADDPHRRIFRTVHLVPGDTDAEFDKPEWVTVGVDPYRVATLEVIDEAELPGRPRGSVSMPADEPWPPPPPEPYRAPADLISATLDFAAVDSGDVLIDLGCGVGDWLAAARLRGAHAIGIEIDGRLVEKARMIDGVEVRHGSVEGADLSEATVVIANMGESLPRNILSLATGSRLVVVDAPPWLKVPVLRSEFNGHSMGLWRL
jgi:SAM-dependent methyltransferase